MERRARPMALTTGAIKTEIEGRVSILWVGSDPTDKATDQAHDVSSQTLVHGSLLQIGLRNRTRAESARMDDTPNSVGWVVDNPGERFTRQDRIGGFVGLILAGSARQTPVIVLTRA